MLYASHAAHEHATTQVLPTTLLPAPAATALPCTCASPQAHSSCLSGAALRQVLQVPHLCMMCLLWAKATKSSSARMMPTASCSLKWPRATI